MKLCSILLDTVVVLSSCINQQSYIFVSIDGYMSSPERSGANRAYEEPYYSQYSGRGNAVTSIIDEEQGYGIIECKRTTIINIFFSW